MNPNCLNGLNTEELKEKAELIRSRIKEVVSKNGGHLSSPLGAVELIMGMHYVFDVELDPFMFDVSHQAYAHKLLTSRWDDFESLRRFNGLCGFTKPEESKYDYFVAGHSSTSISLAVGAAKAIKLKNENRIPVAFIGDGSMSAGMVYESLNELGELKLPVVIVLNDNEMSIAKPMGAISKYLSQTLASPFYQKLKEKTKELLKPLPESATYLAKKLDDSFKLMTPGMLFQEMGIEYIGPIDGHDIEAVIKSLTIAKELQKPVIVHAQTLKGKGYEIAEGKKESWHGVGPFDISSGESKKKKSESATNLFANSLISLAHEHKNVVGVTAAMPGGTGIDRLIELFPQRFWDVSIAEQHAVTSMGALAKEGFKPFITIYSTFLQRAYDQIIHDICIMNLPVVFAIDRAGIVGEDGETHQGAFDISFFRCVPNMTIFAPRCAKSMDEAVKFAYLMKTPCAFRYPRGNFLCDGYKTDKFELGISQLLEKEYGNTLFIGFGNGVGKAIEVARKIDKKVSILDLRFVKPLDTKMLIDLAKKHNKWYVFSDSAKMGGVGSSLMEFLQENDILNVSIKTYEYEDSFIPHGNIALIEKDMKIDIDSIVTSLLEP